MDEKTITPPRRRCFLFGFFLTRVSPHQCAKVPNILPPSRHSSFIYTHASSFVGGVVVLWRTLPRGTGESGVGHPASARADGVGGGVHICVWSVTLRRRCLLHPSLTLGEPRLQKAHTAHLSPRAEGEYSADPRIPSYTCCVALMKLHVYPEPPIRVLYLFGFFKRKYLETRATDFLFFSLFLGGIHDYRRTSR